MRLVVSVRVFQRAGSASALVKQPDALLGVGRPRVDGRYDLAVDAHGESAVAGAAGADEDESLGAGLRCHDQPRMPKVVKPSALW